MGYVVPACRCLFGVVFLVAPFGKVRGRTAFIEFVAAVGDMVPRAARFARPLAIAVVVGETAVSLAMLSGRTAVFGFALAIVMLGAFVIAIALRIRRGAPSRCRCFGSSDVPLGLGHIVRNAALIAVALAGLGGATVRPEISLAPAGTLLSVATGLVFATLFIRFEDLVDVFSTS